MPGTRQVRRTAVRIDCFQNGALPIRLSAERVAELRAALHAAPGAKIGIDLEAQTVRGPDGKIDHFDIDSFRKDCLLKGLDEIGITLELDAAIAAHESRAHTDTPWVEGAARAA